MPDAKPIVYSIDTSSLMDWQDRYYPTDVFPSIVTLFDQLILDERLILAEMVVEEVIAMGSEGLCSWVKANKSICSPTKDHLAQALTIINDFPGLSDPKATHDEADAYVIALAQMRNGAVVVTQETEAATKRRPRRSHFIPDVCRELNIPCINILELLRNENCLL
jgi:hypothetical protein